MGRVKKQIAESKEKIIPKGVIEKEKKLIKEKETKQEPKKENKQTAEKNTKPKKERKPRGPTRRQLYAQAKEFRNKHHPKVCLSKMKKADLINYMTIKQEEKSDNV